MATEHLTAELANLAAHIARRRDDILGAWREAVLLDPKLTTGASLPRAQLQDHIPALLEDFERKLAADRPKAHAQADRDQRGDAAAHGLHRWQQGFDLAEVTRELGRLNECVVVELEHYADGHPSLQAGVMAEARRIWAQLSGMAISASTSQFFELQQLEASGHVRDLERALETLRDMENQRAELWRQAAHDLRGNLSVVSNATAGLTSARITEDARSTFLRLLDRNVQALHRLLEDVTSLARLQGGQEHRTVAEMDASVLLRDLCEGAEAIAKERALSVRGDGPPSFVVDGDATKVRRIVQNLLLNAINYTRQGGVSVSWGPNGPDDPDRWFVQVADTGPGFHSGPGAQLAGALESATDQARAVGSDAASGEVTHVDIDESERPRGRADPRPVHQQAGEGIGLSIVKRLCTLLDATIEMDSVMNEGTRFRVLLPKQYGS